MDEDTTQNLPNDSDKAPTTHPMLEAILAKVTEGFATTHQEIASLRQDMDSLRQDMREVKDQLRKIDIRLGIFSDEMSKLKAESIDHERRLGDLERKAS